MKMGFGYARRAAAATLALAGLVILTGPLHVRNEILSTAAHADEIRKMGYVCDWDKLDWEEMSGAEKHAWEALGWSRALWDSETNEAASSGKDWDELTPRERTAAQLLGYDAQSWETNCPR
jgi:hypothetical protein